MGEQRSWPLKFFLLCRSKSSGKLGFWWKFLQWRGISDTSGKVLLKVAQRANSDREGYIILLPTVPSLSHCCTQWCRSAWAQQGKITHFFPGIWATITEVNQHYSTIHYYSISAIFACGRFQVKYFQFEKAKSENSRKVFIYLWKRWLMAVCCSPSVRSGLKACWTQKIATFTWSSSQYCRHFLEWQRKS